MIRTFVTTIEELKTEEGVAAWDKRLNDFQELCASVGCLAQASINVGDGLVVVPTTVFKEPNALTKVPTSITASDFAKLVAMRAASRPSPRVA